jgi:hypothetical protein
MAYAQDPSVVHKLVHTAFDRVYNPGDIVPESGIFKCLHCTHEIVSTEGNKFPPQTHPAHPSGWPIQWKLIIVPRHNQ